ncbi:unnamed protein product [Caretta caretta]
MEREYTSFFFFFPRELNIGTRQALLLPIQGMKNWSASGIYAGHLFRSLSNNSFTHICTRGRLDPNAGAGIGCADQRGEPCHHYSKPHLLAGTRGNPEDQAGVSSKGRMDH